MGHNPENIADADVIVRSAAIKDDNPEIVAANEQGIPVIERADLLGYITKQYAKAICVSGTHGKTTVSSMLTYILMTANEDISAVVGGKLGILDGGSGRTGTSDIMICEACEYSDTFLKLDPNISVILNINQDHLEYFKTMDNLRLSFTKFCNITSDVLVVNGDDENTMTAVNNSNFNGRLVKFGRAETNDYYPKNVQGRQFDLFKQGDFLTRLTLNVPGEHNILNAVAACAAAHCAGVCESVFAEGLESFGGAGRRFEVLARINDVTVVDDYAHHPTEITATLSAARDFMLNSGDKSSPLKKMRVWAVHQPFTYSRTKTMLDEFAESLSGADKVTLTEVMGGREVNNHDVCSADLAERVRISGDKACNWFVDFEEVADYVSANSQPGDLIITLGCGDVNKVAHLIVEKLRKK